MKGYDPNMEFSCVIYWGVNNLYRQAMWHKLPVDDFGGGGGNKKSKYTQKFIRGHDDDSNKDYILKVDVICPMHLQKIHRDLPFLPEIINIDKCQKLVCNLFEEKNYVIMIKALKLALNYGLMLEKINRKTQINHEAWLKPQINMNIKLSKRPQIIFRQTSL